MDWDEITQKIRKFATDRNWEQFHNPKDLSTAIGIEAAELQELFLWKNSNEVEKAITESREEIEHEVADILTYLIRLIDVMDIDIESVINTKLEINERKYPVSLSKGKNLKYDQL